MTLLSELMSTKTVAEIFGFKAGFRHVIKLIETKQLKAIWLKNFKRWAITPEAVEEYKKLRESRNKKQEVTI